MLCTVLLLFTLVRLDGSKQKVAGLIAESQMFEKEMEISNMSQSIGLAKDITFISIEPTECNSRAPVRLSKRKQR